MEYKLPFSISNYPKPLKIEVDKNAQRLEEINVKLDELIKSKESADKLIGENQEYSSQIKEELEKIQGENDKKLATIKKLETKFKLLKPETPEDKDLRNSKFHKKVQDATSILDAIKKEHSEIEIEWIDKLEVGASRKEKDLYQQKIDERKDKISRKEKLSIKMNTLEENVRLAQEDLDTVNSLPSPYEITQKKLKELNDDFKHHMTEVLKIKNINRNNELLIERRKYIQREIERVEEELNVFKRRNTLSLSRDIWIEYDDEGQPFEITTYSFRKKLRDLEENRPVHNVVSTDLQLTLERDYKIRLLNELEDQHIMYLSISSINLSKEIESIIISLEKQIKTMKQQIKLLNTQIDKLPKSIWEEEDKKEYNRRFENIYREHDMELPYEEPSQFKNTIKKMTLNEYLKSLR
jgi:hypothetical protein